MSNEAKIAATHVQEKQCKFCKSNLHEVNECPSISRKNESKINLTCQSCGKSGHSSKTCFQVKNLLLSQINPTCDYCDRPNHTAKNCYKLFPNNPRNGNASGMQPRAQVKCDRCQSMGHTAANCNRMSNVTCNYCKLPGHLIENCRRREFNNQARLLGNGGGPSPTNGTREGQ